MYDAALAERFSCGRRSDATGETPPSEHASNAKVDAVTSVRWFLFMTHSWQGVEVPADRASLPAKFHATDTYCYVVGMYCDVVVGFTVKRLGHRIRYAHA